MKDKLIRGLAEYHHDKKLAVARAKNPESWVDRDEEYVAHARERIAKAVAKQIEQHPSKASHANAQAFTEAVAGLGATQAAWGAGVGPEFSKLRAGWEARHRNAIKAVEALSHALAVMEAEELELFLPPDYVAHPGRDAMDANPHTLTDWVNTTQAVSQHFEAFQSRAAEKGKLWHHIAPDVWMLANYWVDYFHEIPAAADGSPFTSVVEAYILALYPSMDSAPSHPNIRAALAQRLPTLRERTRKTQRKSLP